MVANATPPAQGTGTVPPAEVANRFAQGLPTELIDVRTPVEFASVHADGARLVPLDKLDPHAVIAGRTGTAPAPIYVICQSGTRAAKAVQQFREAGFTDVMSVEGGTAAWERAGLPVVRGTNRVISLERQVRIGAGLLVLLGAVLAWLVHPAFIILPAFVGAGLVFAGVTDWCGMGMLLAKMPWNTRVAGEGAEQSGCAGGACTPGGR